MKTPRFLAALLLSAAFHVSLPAQEAPLYERGATYQESTMPPSPGPASAVKYVDIPFSHSAGLAEYDVPFYTLEGRELSIPIGLHYASGGIKLDEIAGVAGLGWMLEAGGCITRTVMDLPDEFRSGGTRHEMPSGELLSDLEAQIENNDTKDYLRDLLEHYIDGSLDRYSYNVCGLRGSFVIKDDGTVFQFGGDGVAISYTLASDDSVDSFTLTGPDGTVYILSEKETVTHCGRGENLSFPSSNRPDRWSATTAWHITQMRSCSGLETATFTYSEPQEWDNVIRSNRNIISVRERDVQTDYSITSRTSSMSIHNSYSVKVISGIVLNGYTVSFSYATDTGRVNHSDMISHEDNYPFRLTGISVRSAGNPTELIRLDAGTSRAQYDGRIILETIRLYRGGILDDSWDFTYHTLDCPVSRGSQDWYGYYNGENEFSFSGTPAIGPFAYQGGRVLMTGGYPDPSRARYMSLIRIDHDRAVTRFSYSGNVIASATDTVSVGIKVGSIDLIGTINPIYRRHFTYESPQCTGPSVPTLDMYTTIEMNVRSLDCDRDYTLHDSPVVIGPSIRDTRVYYGKVREDITTQVFINNLSPINGDSVRTIYTFSTTGVYPDEYTRTGRFPSAAAACYDAYALSFWDPWDGVRKGYTDSGQPAHPVLTRMEQYSYEDDEYRLVSSIDYTYDTGARNSVLVDYHVSEVLDDDGAVAGVFDIDNIYHFPVYASSWSGRYPVKEVHVGYHTSGNDTTVISRTYVSRTTLSKPVRLKTVATTENGITRTLSYTYADTWEGFSLWVSSLSGKHCLAQPLKKSYVYCRRMVGIADSSGHTISTFPVTYKEEVIEYGRTDVGGSFHSLPSAHKEFNLGEESWNETVLSRDCMGNISSFKEKGHPETVILWSYGGRYPVAVIENSTMSLVANFLGGQNFIDGLTRAVSPSQTHLATLSAMRRILTDTRVTTYSYLPGIGVTSMTDPAGITTTYEYDHAGRLTCIRDNDGNKVEEYSYSLMTDDNGHKHMGSKVYRSEDGQVYSEDVRWWDKYGRRVEDISIDASGDGRDLVTAYGSDFMFHDDVRTWLPYPVETSGGQFQDEADTLSAAFHGNDAAYTLKKYEVSSRDRVTSTALPGYAGAHETIYETDVVADFPVLRWENGEVSQIGEYASDQVVVEKTVDPDGRLKSVFKDNLGRILGTSNGDDEPTYHVYDRFDRLCAVVGSGIELSDTLNMWRYDYDSLGRLASKGIPSSVREYYEYDSEDRLVSVQRGNLLEEYEYDAFGRVTGVYRTVAGGVRTVCESHTYDTYPAGVTGSNPKGLVTRSRLGIICPNGTIGGNVRIEYSYDDRKRPVQIVRYYNDGSVLVEDMTYEFSGEVKSRVWRYIHGASEDILSSDYAYDVRGRLLSEASTISIDGEHIHTGVHVFSYDDMGRMYRSRSFTPGGPELESVASFTLQGWQESLAVSYDDRFLFMQELGYDGAGSVTGHVPQYSGLVTLKDETWFSEGVAPVTSAKIYRYDSAGRLSFEGQGIPGTSYTYDARGNMLTYGIVPSIIPRMSTLDYSGDRLTTLSRYRKDDVYFTYDSFGRMTSDGLNDTQMEYNFLNLVRKVSRDSTVLVNYSYLADGTKLSASDGDGEGLVYRGPFVYRHSADGDGNSSLTFESASFGGGLLTSSGVLLYVKDYLGSVVAVLDADSGALYKAVGYSAYGDDSSVSAVPTVSLPLGITLRAGYTGQEDQHADFGTGYVDFGARQYSPALRRWLIPDPQSEKSYGTSPYAFCNSNPVNYVDVDGEFPDFIWDLASIGMGIRSLVDNIQEGNTRAAIGDGVGIVADVIAAAIPVLPGGVGAVRAGAKAAVKADDVVDAARGADATIDAVKATDGKLYVTYTKKNPVTGEVYSGRTSGYGDPQDIIAKRDREHHMNKKGFKEAQIDRFSTDPDAIRGREQYLIDLHGGAKSQGGTSGNAINGISPTNPNKKRYVEANEREIGWQH